jgi:hypothetical protein
VRGDSDSGAEPIADGSTDCESDRHPDAVAHPCAHRIAVAVSDAVSVAGTDREPKPSADAVPIAVADRIADRRPDRVADSRMYSGQVQAQP